jgi:hypothetical protein
VVENRYHLKGGAVIVVVEEGEGGGGSCCRHRIRNEKKGLMAQMMIIRRLGPVSSSPSMVGNENPSDSHFKRGRGQDVVVGAENEEKPLRLTF